MAPQLLLALLIERQPGSGDYEKAARDIAKALNSLATEAALKPREIQLYAVVLYRHPHILFTLRRRNLCRTMALQGQLRAEGIGHGTTTPAFAAALPAATNS